MNLTGELTLPGRGGAQHKYLQQLVRKVALERGYAVSLEEEILGGHGYVDVVLEKGETRIACEISVTTRVAHELENLTKCLSSDFTHVVFLSSTPSALKAARSQVAPDPRLHFLTPENFIAFLEKLESPISPEAPKKKRNQGEEAVGRASGKRAKLETWDAATYVGLARQTLAKLRVTGGGPKFHKLGSRVVYDPDDLEAWLAERKRSSTSQR